MSEPTHGIPQAVLDYEQRSDWRAARTELSELLFPRWH